MTSTSATNRPSWRFVHKSSSLCHWLSSERVPGATRLSSSHLVAINSPVSADIRCATYAARTSGTEKATATSASTFDQTVDEAVRNAQSAICTGVRMTRS
jgi:hypothetical protein